jgi:hypothetical protein
MSDRVYASVFYVVLIVGSSWAAVTVGEALAREALARLALIPSADQHPSRVEAALAAQEHIASPLSSRKEVLIPAAPSMPVGALAKALDDAEQNTQEDSEEPKAMPLAARPRVAGWVKRFSRRAEPSESSGRIIMRTLRAEM